MFGSYFALQCKLVGPLDRSWPAGADVPSDVGLQVRGLHLWLNVGSSAVYECMYQGHVPSRMRAVCYIVDWLKRHVLHPICIHVRYS